MNTILKSTVERKLAKAAKLAKALAQLNSEIEAAVLELGETVAVEGAAANYRATSRSYAHESAVRGRMSDDDPQVATIIKACTKEVVDWRRAGKLLKVDPDFSDGGPVVRVKFKI